LADLLQDRGVNRVVYDIGTQGSDNRKNRESKNRTFTFFFKYLIVDSPAFPPAKPQCESLGVSNLKTFGKGPQKLFSLLIYD